MDFYSIASGSSGNCIYIGSDQTCVLIDAGISAIIQPGGSVRDAEVIDAARADLGLDKPFLTQYFTWLGGMLTGDMGTSYI